MHLAAYLGYPRAVRFDESITRVEQVLTRDGVQIAELSSAAPAATELSAEDVYATVGRRPLPARDSRFHLGKRAPCDAGRGFPIEMQSINHLT